MMPAIEIGEWKKQDFLQRWITGRKVKAWMLYPKDEKRQDDYIVLSVAKVFNKLYESGTRTSAEKSEWSKRNFDPVGGLEGVMFSREYSKVMKEASDFHLKGMITGLMLYRMVQIDRENKSGSIKQRSSLNKVSEVIAELTEIETKSPLIARDVKDYWKVLKSSAHLWAAHLVFAWEVDLSDFKGIWPHSRDDLAFIDLPNFFHVSNFFLKFGMNHHSHNKKVATFMPDDDMVLPPVEYWNDTTDPNIPDLKSLELVKHILENYQAPKSTS